MFRRQKITAKPVPVPEVAEEATVNAVVDLASIQTFLEAIEYRVARSRTELEKAYSLVYREYLKRGYVKESPLKMKFSLFNALPQVTTFIAALEDDIISTATVIPDSPLGLPMDDIYHEELEKLRTENKRICEISMLASETELFKSGVSLMLNSKKMFFIFCLFKAIFDYAIDVLKMDDICISINPKHSLTYDFIMFKTLGGLKAYENANGAPAVGKYLDLNTVEEECKIRDKEGLYRMFFCKKTPPEKFDGKMALSPRDLRYFFVEHTEIFRNASPAQLEYIRKSYPTYSFSEILS